MSSRWRIRCAYRPEVVHEQIENAQQNHQQDGAQFGFESYHHHDAGNQANQAHDDSPKAPRSGKHEADEKEDEKYPSTKLDIHLPILLVHLRQSRKDPFADPAVGQDHEEPAHDGQITEEKVEIEDEAVAQGLGDHHPNQANHSVLGVFADDDHCRADTHSNDVGEEEKMGYAPRNCRCPGQHTVRAANSPLVNY